MHVPGLCWFRLWVPSGLRGGEQAALFFVVITTLIGSLQVFDVIYMMIHRSNAALPYVQSVVVLFYRYAFEMNMKGYGSAIIILLFLVILLITYIQLKLQKKWVHY